VHGFARHEYGRTEGVATVFERVRALIVEQLGVEESQVSMTASFVDELIMSIEEEFTTDGQNVEIADEDAEKITRVEDAVNFIHDAGIEDE
jgi:acyl carrier protein